MAKSAGTAWGIDLGNNALKAIKITNGQDEKVEVLDYAVIEHESILTSQEITPAQRLELIQKALEKFTDEHDLSGCQIVVGVPGQNSFARFAKLPPVDKKRIPDMVRYEAQQQIPFDINDVEWDWQVLSEDEDAQEIEIGIFAIKSDVVRRALMPFTEANIMINKVQMGPMALFNYLSYDKTELSKSENAVIIIDIGAENTDLIISNKGKVWQRSIKIGGNHFTAAVQKSFKLSFLKAENIKRTANTSKYARQIFQAMRPVFSDLAAEIQRSLGFYSSGNRDTQFGEALAMGNAIKLPGLLKFLQQSLSLPIKRVDTFDLATPSEDISIAEFSGHIPCLATAYGLALQGLDEGAITGNLLPREIIRKTQWKRKHKWLIASCAMIALGSAAGLGKAMSSSSDISQAKTIIAQTQGAVSKVNESASVKSEAISKIDEIKETINKHKELYGDRSLVQNLYKSLIETLPNSVHCPDQAALYQAVLDHDLESVYKTPRGDRKQVYISSLKMAYTDDLNQSFEEVIVSSTNGMGGQRSLGGGMPRMATPGRQGFGIDESSSEDTAAKSGFVVVIEGSTPNKSDLEFLNPPTAGTDRSQWGFFTRLYYLGKTDEAVKTMLESKAPNVAAAPQNKYQSDENAKAQALPFESYIGSSELKLYFDTDEGAKVTGIDNTLQPAGIGVQKAAMNNTGFGGRGEMNMGRDVMMGAGAAATKQLPQLIDPFTQEVISTEYVEDKNGEIVIENGKPITVEHDYWFRVKMKIALKAAGSDIESEVQ